MAPVSVLRIARFVVGGLVLGYGAMCLAGHLAYRKLLYPAPQTDGVAPPAGARLLSLRASDGVTVNAMAFERPEATRTVVYFHGNGDVIGDDVWTAERLVAQGFGVILVEYRGYGRSRGPEPTEDGLYADATAVLDDLAARGTGADRVVLWGISLGTGVATEMAKRGRGAALVLVAPYTSIPDMGARLVPFLPVRALVGDRFENLSKAGEVRVPTVVVHGTDDEVIPFAMGERVAAAIPGSRFERIDGGRHMDCFLRDEGLIDRVARAVR